jgi:predicted transcriptional regulator
MEKQISIRLDEQLIKDIKKLAIDKDISYKEAVEQALCVFLDIHNDGKMMEKYERLDAMFKYERPAHRLIGLRLIMLGEEMKRL